MNLLAIPYPRIDPVAISIGPFAIKWYGLAYLAGLLLGWLYIRRLLREERLWAGGKAPFAPDRTDDLLLWMTLGVVIGGRLGFVLLYEPGYYLKNLLEIPAVWRGGMSFHGALLGCGVAVAGFAARNATRPATVMDLCAAAVPLGIFFGRMANFINAELFGRPTDVPWAMVFPGPEAGPIPRHPSQLYEAALEGLALFVLLRWLTHSRLALHSPGFVTGMFLAGYGVARSFCELFRAPDAQHALTFGVLTPGIAYSIPMIVGGLWLMSRARAAKAA